MVVIAKTYTTLGIQGYEVQVEADSARAIPTIDIIGLPDAAVKESKSRIQSTLRNVDITLPPRKIILNLAPSDVKKSGTSFDLPMAVALLKLVQKSERDTSKYLFFGELGLDGGIKRVNALLPAILAARKDGYTKFVVPADNVYELAYVPDIQLYVVNHFSQLKSFIAGGDFVPVYQSPQTLTDLCATQDFYDVDFVHIKGHVKIKRALTIAAAGGHNVLLIGAPGSGKTMLSKALQSILPPMHFQEVLDVSQVYSVIGALDKNLPLITQRPFRQVHHTASRVAIVGGGQRMTPGEVSLAHKGILFFDELAEFPREVLEVLRQPLEDKSITISRANGTVQYPANFMFVASMNPCKCGFYKDPDKACKCSYLEIKRYQSKISGPLLDRIDIVLEVPREKIETIMEEKNIQSDQQSSQRIRQIVDKARQQQQSRFEGTNITANAHMASHHIQQHISLNQKSKQFIQSAAKQLHLSPRVVHRSIKLARTIADVAGEETVGMHHIAEAMQYRSKTMFAED